MERKDLEQLIGMKVNAVDGEYVLFVLEEPKGKFAYTAKVKDGMVWRVGRRQVLIALTTDAPEGLKELIKSFSFSPAP